jgi:hypothetical protein
VVTARPSKNAPMGLGEAIRAKITEEDTTLENAALSLGLPPNALSRWNSGTEPGPQFYGVLMGFLGVSLSELGALIVEDQLRRSGLPRP